MDQEGHGQTNTDEFVQAEDPTSNERRSQREKKNKRSFSPELDSRKKRRKARPQSSTASNRPYDLMPDGEPFCCKLCKSPYVTNPYAKGVRKAKRSRHVPLPKKRLDSQGREILVCNACCQILDRQLKPRKVSKELPAETRNKYLEDAQMFARSLAETLNEPEAEKLYCPVSIYKLCGCLQQYIKGKDSDESALELRVTELLDLMKEAAVLREQKVYSTPDHSNSKAFSRRKLKYVGYGNGHKKSKEFEEFVLEKRRILKEDLRLCERASQKILLYSNNFLHKKLKTEERSCRIVRTRGKAALGKLDDIDTLHEQMCCIDVCVRLAISHPNLLKSWRSRALSGQMEARKVIGEMLTPAGGYRLNCYTFISMVTGCSLTTIGKVNNQLRITGGRPDQPEHGMKRVWTHGLRNRVGSETSSTTTCAGTVQDHQSVHSQSIAGQEVTEVLRTSQNQTTSCSSNGFQPSQQFERIGELVKKKLELQQQQQLVQYQIQQTLSQYPALVQNTGWIPQIVGPFPQGSAPISSTILPVVNLPQKNLSHHSPSVTNLQGNNPGQLQIISNVSNQSMPGLSQFGFGCNQIQPVLNQVGASTNQEANNQVYAGPGQFQPVFGQSLCNDSLIPTVVEQNNASSVERELGVRQMNKRPSQILPLPVNIAAVQNNASSSNNNSGGPISMEVYSCQNVVSEASQLHFGLSKSEDVNSHLNLDACTKQHQDGITSHSDAILRKNLSFSRVLPDTLKDGNLSLQSSVDPNCRRSQAEKRGFLSGVRNATAGEASQTVLYSADISKSAPEITYITPACETTAETGVNSIDITKSTPRITYIAAAGENSGQTGGVNTNTISSTPQITYIAPAGVTNSQAGVNTNIKSAPHITYIAPAGETSGQAGVSTNTIKSTPQIAYIAPAGETSGQAGVNTNTISSTPQITYITPAGESSGQVRVDTNTIKSTPQITYITPAGVTCSQTGVNTNMPTPQITYVAPDGERSDQVGNNTNTITSTPQITYITAAGATSSQTGVNTNTITSTPQITYIAPAGQTSGQAGVSTDTTTATPQITYFIIDQNGSVNTYATSDRTTESQLFSINNANTNGGTATSFEILIPAEQQIDSVKKSSNVDTDNLVDLPLLRIEGVDARIEQGSQIFEAVPISQSDKHFIPQSNCTSQGDCTEQISDDNVDKSDNISVEPVDVMLPTGLQATSHIQNLVLPSNLQQHMVAEPNNELDSTGETVLIKPVTNMDEITREMVSESGVNKKSANGKRKHKKKERYVEQNRRKTERGSEDMFGDKSVDLNDEQNQTNVNFINQEAETVHLPRHLPVTAMPRNELHLTNTSETGGISADKHQMKVRKSERRHRRSRHPSKEEGFQKLQSKSGKIFLQSNSPTKREAKELFSKTQHKEDNVSLEDREKTPCTTTSSTDMAACVSARSALFTDRSMVEHSVVTTTSSTGMAACVSARSALFTDRSMVEHSVVPIECSTIDLSENVAEVSEKCSEANTEPELHAEIKSTSNKTSNVTAKVKNKLRQRLNIPILPKTQNSTNPPPVPLQPLQSSLFVVAPSSQDINNYLHMTKSTVIQPQRLAVPTSYSSQPIHSIVSKPSHPGSLTINPSSDAIVNTYSTNKVSGTSLGIDSFGRNVTIDYRTDSSSDLVTVGNFPQVFLKSIHDTHPSYITAGMPNINQYDQSLSLAKRSNVQPVQTQPFSHSLINVPQSIVSSGKPKTGILANWKETPNNVPRSVHRTTTVLLPSAAALKSDCELVSPSHLVELSSDMIQSGIQQELNLLKGHPD